jgi:hypothetical protein
MIGMISERPRRSVMELIKVRNISQRKALLWAGLKTLKSCPMV